MIDVFLTTIYPEKVKNILAPSVVGRARVLVRVVAATPIKDPPPIEGVRWIFHDGDVMPAQEAALKACVGPYVVHAVDDLSYDPGCLDAMLDVVQIHPRTIVGPQYWHNGALEAGAHYPGLFLNLQGKGPDRWPMNGMYRLGDLMEVMPYDPLYRADYGFSDLTLQLIARGWKVVLLDQLRVNDIGATDENSLWLRRGQHDWRSLVNKWAPGGVIDPRLAP